jgi:hypothetical protein
MAKLAIAFLILCSLITRSESGVTAVRASDFSSLDGGSETPEASRMRGWIAGADFAELVRANAISPNRNGIKIASMIAVPPSATSVLGVDGANDFSLAYVIQALTYSLIATGDPHLGSRLSTAATRCSPSVMQLQNRGTPSDGSTVLQVSIVRTLGEGLRDTISHR